MRITILDSAMRPIVDGHIYTFVLRAALAGSPGAQQLVDAAARGQPLMFRVEQSGITLQCQLKPTREMLNDS